MNERPSTRGRRNEISVEEVGPDGWDAWGSFVVSANLGSVYSLPTYLDVLGRVVGADTRVLVARRGDSIVGGVAVLEQRAPIGTFVSPRFLLYYNGFVLREYATRYPSERVSRQSEVVAELAEHLAGMGYGRLELRSRSTFADARPLLERGWTVTPSYTYVVPLGDLESLWSRVEQNTRRLVERGRGFGFELVVDDDFESFHRLHAATADRKGAPIYLGLDDFRSYYYGLRARGLCSLYHARADDGRVAASQLVLLGHSVTHTVSAAADAGMHNTGANAWLRWSVFEHLAAQGFMANDLTDASQPSVARFKAQLGGDLEQSLCCERPLSLAFAAERRARRGVTGVRRHLQRRR
jgi:hypothetical protein